MRTRRFLILAPLVLIAMLAQAYVWVPTYEDQTAGSEDRLVKFVDARIGDAKILNPVLLADVPSSLIAQHLFEGLLKLDHELALRGQLASSWQLSESVYLTVPPGSPDDAVQLRHRILSAIEDGTISLGDTRMLGIDRLAAASRTLAVQVPGNGDEVDELQLEVRVPERLRFRLDRVDQDLAERLAPVIGDDYGAGLSRLAWVTPLPQRHTDEIEKQLEQLLPVVEHNPELLFELRRGVRFHDGHEFDSGDVAFTYQALITPRNLSPRTSDFEPVKSVEALDKYRVKVVYKRLFSPAVNAWTMGILPQHLLNDTMLATEADERGISGEARETFGLRDSRFNRHPVGTGPFVFVQWQSDELIHLRRNDDYWDRPPEYHDYYYRVIPDALTREVEFRTGAVDRFEPEPYQVARYRDDTRYQTLSTLRLGYSYIGYNNRRALFSDPNVRRALGMAINVEEITRYVLSGEGEAVTGPYPRTTPWYADDVATLAYDPQGALEILREAGWRTNADGWLEKDGDVFEFNLITNNGNQKRRAILSIAQDAWKRIGIKCNTQVFEWAVFLEDFINPADFDAVILGWQLTADPDLYQLWHSSQAGRNQLNFVGYASARADQLIERIRREYDRERQVEMARALHRTIAADQPYTFLYAPRENHVFDRKIVSINQHGTHTALRVPRSGEVMYFFNHWRKLEEVP